MVLYVAEKLTCTPNFVEHTIISDYELQCILCTSFASPGDLDFWTIDLKLARPVTLCRWNYVPNLNFL